METKAAHRSRLKAHRDALSVEARRDWSAVIAAHLGRIGAEREVTRIGVFWPLGSEVDLRPAIDAQPDWQWLFPRITSLDPPRLAWGPMPLEPGPWGLREPVCSPYPLPPVQWLLVPGLAFDDQGYRIGYGKGFYDALLPQLAEAVLTVGVGFEAQMHHPVPIAPHDWPVQALLSERGFRLLRGGQA
jgi:5-formyltetrahydrofolate cyclo-ligase